jgi:hypothetical protein
MGLRENRKITLKLFLDTTALLGIICAGCERRDSPEIGGPMVICTSGTLLLCAVKTGGIAQPYVISLADRSSRPVPLQFPGCASCLGAVWIRGGCDELLFITGGEPQHIKTLRLVANGVSEMSSYSVDPNLLVTVPLSYGGSTGRILALRVVKLSEGTSSGPYLGFSKDNGKTITISDIAAPVALSWVDDHTCYTTYSVKEDIMRICRMQLNAENMTWDEEEVLMETNVLLGVHDLRRGLVYAVGKKVYRSGRLVGALPEEGTRPLVNDSCIACVSKNGRRVYMLTDEKGIIGRIEKSAGSRIVGLSAMERCIYLVTEDRDQILRRDFIDGSESIVFDTARLP